MMVVVGDRDDGTKAGLKPGCRNEMSTWVTSATL